MDSHVWKWEWAGSIGCSRLRIFFLLAAENVRNFHLIIDFFTGENVSNINWLLISLQGRQNIRNYQLIIDLLAGENVRDYQLVSAWLFINDGLVLRHFLFLVWHCDWWQFKGSTFTNTYIFPCHPIDRNSVCDIVQRWHIDDNISYWWHDDILLTKYLYFLQ